MSRHVLIIGGGILGCLSAMKLRQRGLDVTLVEQEVIGGHDNGAASWAAAGILFPLLPWTYTDAVNRMAVAGMAAYPQLCDELLSATGINPEYQADGMLLLPPTDVSKALAWAERYQFQAVIREETAHHAGGIWFPQLAHVRSPRLLQALRQWLIQHGVAVRENTRLLPLKMAGNTHLRAVITDAGEELVADDFVLTSGAWSQNLLAQGAAELSIKPVRGQMLLYRPSVAGMLSHMIFREGFYLVPRQDGLILAGSCAEDVGFVYEATEAMARELAAKAVAILPGLKDSTPVGHWSGFRPGSPNNLPTVDRHPDIENLYVNTGHFRYGLTMAPASVDILAAIMLKEKPENPALCAADYAFAA